MKYSIVFWSTLIVLLFSGFASAGGLKSFTLPDRDLAPCTIMILDGELWAFGCYQYTEEELWSWALGVLDMPSGMALSGTD